MSGIIQGLIASLKSAASATTDAYFNLVTLLLNTSSTNGAQNNTFQDSSSSPLSITRNPATGPNAPTQGIFTPFSQTGWSNYFDGTDDYLAIADNVLLRFGAGAFTLEAWIWRNASGAAHTIYAKGGASTGIVFQVASTNVLRFTHTTTNIDSTGTIATNSWTHVAVVREGTGANQTKLYINGTQDGQGTVSTDFTQTEEVRIGTDRGATADFNGYISNLRFVKGTALYTTTFTPSTTPLTTTSQGATATEVELLTCQSNRFLDNSLNAFAITASGTPSVQAFEPFAPTAAYDAAVVGGSGYFSTSSTYLSNTTYNSATTGNFTVEAWVYFNNLTQSDNTIVNLGSETTGRAIFSVTSAGQIRINLSGSANFNFGSTGAVVVGTWNHIAYVRNGTGTNNITAYLNGVSVGSVTNTAQFGNSGGFRIGASTATANLFLNGYISSARVTIGTAVYTGTFAIPTSPFTASMSANPFGGSNTAACTASFLLNFTNAGIFDSAAKNNLETVADAQVSNAQNKFGTTSIVFDGTGDYLLLPDSPNLQLGTGDFTIEGFVFLDIAGVAYGIISKGAASTGWSVNITSGNKLQFSYTATQLTGATSLAATTWYYFAVVRSGSATGNLKLYLGTSGSTTLDATSAGAVTDNFNQTNSMYVGASRTGTTILDGYLEEIRITKGYARTVTTVPTAAFPVQ